MPARIPRNALPLLHRLKAKKMMERGEKISDAQVIAEALRFEEQHEQTPLKEKKFNILDFVGFIKGGPRTNATRDLDKVLYGKKK